MPCDYRTQKAPYLADSGCYSHQASSLTSNMLPAPGHFPPHPSASGWCCLRPSQEPSSLLEEFSSRNCTDVPSILFQESAQVP